MTNIYMWIEKNVFLLFSSKNLQRANNFLSIVIVYSLNLYEYLIDKICLTIKEHIKHKKVMKK